ncbi:MAG: hypothetical protein HYU97_00960 [Deltaproteobacteria bacterium]|nr:hypothetical protein [Deltaproteobacteria bacterium]
MKDLQNEIRAIAKSTKDSERNILIASIIAEALRQIGQDPILVGGAAVEFYTQGGYSTADIDMVTPGGPALEQAMKALGFEKFGKDFFSESLKVYVEFPSTHLKTEERFNSIKINQVELKIISIEDLIVDRLCSYKFWNSEIDGINALLLMEAETLDQARLKKRATLEQVADAYEGLCKIQEIVIRKKLAPEMAEQLLKNLQKAMVKIKETTKKNG